MNYKEDVIIGTETHLSLNKVKTKLFCGCSLPEPDSKPNTHTCPICLAMPGAKPVTNKKAVEHALKLALALNSKIQPELIFSRKVYAYVDLPSGYQRTQYEIPLGIGGSIELSSGKEIRLIRVHLEEDPGALIHPEGIEKSPYVLIDYNRSGIPLCEIVTEPNINSPEEAREFMNKLITIVQYLNISDPAKSAIKADVNISIKESNYTKVEIKNITGFKEIERALRYEIERQRQVIREGRNLIQETRAWDSERGITFPLRAKETEEEYGYVIDSDLVPIELTQDWLDKIKKSLPELAHEKELRFIKQYKIAKDDSKIISSDLRIADFFEQIAKKINPILAAKWTRRELLRVLNYNKIDISETKLKSENFIELLLLVESKKITDENAKRILEKLIIKPFSIKDYIKKQDLKVISSEKELEDICKKIIKENPQPVQDYKKGEEKALNFLIGQVMKLTKGQASPEIINKIIKKLI